MKKIFNKNTNFLWSSILCMSLLSCVEPIDFETGREFESALVVEGTITDELKQHQIKITRTYRFEDNSPDTENQAIVNVVDDMGNTYPFQEQEPGIYISTEEFRAMPGRNYSVEIRTTNGGHYKSEPTDIASSAEIEAVTPERVIGVNGQDGVALVLKGSPGGGGDSYYRYEYVETYKRISPFFISKDLIVEGGKLMLVDKTREEYICFTTVKSSDIIVASTENLSEDEVDGLVIRFIETGNPVMSRRYSIQVKQYGISPEAHRFYETLKNLSESESLFSQIQPGFLPGNLYSVSDPDEMVLGFFNVSEVSVTRIFFNYTDFYADGGDRPSFVRDCVPLEFEDALLMQMLQEGSVKFFDEVAPGGPYKVMKAACIDCTLNGTNQTPEFWIEED